MENEFSRTEMLFGKAAMEALQRAHVAVFGVGGVGGHTVEVLARSGVGAIDLFDNDTVSITNLNRQLIALHSTIGRPKVIVAAERIADINPHCQVEAHQTFYLPENADTIDLGKYDYVIDCVDTVAAKIELIKRCHEQEVPLICSMGAANKLDPCGFRVADISKTTMDPLAKVIRKKLRKLNIHHVKVVFSEEPPLSPLFLEASGKRVPASNAFVPASAGLIIGGEVVKDIINKAHAMRITDHQELG